MNLWKAITWTRHLFGIKTSSEKIRKLENDLEQCKGSVAQFDQTISNLEIRESQLLILGKDANDERRRSYAREILRIRSELKTERTGRTVALQQMNILSGYLNTRRLAHMSTAIKMPKPKELAAVAAQSEQVIADLSNTADLAHQIEVNVVSTTSAEEESILKEFDAGKTVQDATAGKVTPQMKLDAERETKRINAINEAERNARIERIKNNKAEIY